MGKGAFGMNGLLTDQLSQLDVPADARLTSVTTTEDADGTTTWTVTYKARRTANASVPFGLSSTPVAAAPPAERRTFPLCCEVKTYAWGRMSEESLVARLKEAGDDEFSIAKDTPYGELWMGTHPSGPSMVRTHAPRRTHSPRPRTVAPTHARPRPPTPAHARPRPPTPTPHPPVAPKRARPRPPLPLPLPQPPPTHTPPLVFAGDA